MIIITLLLTNLIWIAYSMIDGFREGFYWHYRNNSRRTCEFEINRIFSLQRSLVILLIAGFLVYTLGWFSLISTISMIMLFSYFHNGTYYLTRNKLDDKMYPMRWKDESRTLPVFYSGLMKYNKRTVLMILGLLIQIFVYIFLL
jgi:hypothetical protein